MRTREVAVIALKVLSVYVLFEFLTYLPTSVSTVHMGAQMGRHEGELGGVEGSLRLFAIAAGITSLAYLAFALILFFGARRLSCSLVQDSEDQLSLSGLGSSDILTMAFRCLGVYAVVTWAPNLIQTLVRTIIYGTWYDHQVPFLKRFYDNWSVLLSPTMGSLLGLLLIFRAKGLLRLIQLSRPMSKPASEAKGTQE